MSRTTAAESLVFSTMIIPTILFNRDINCIDHNSRSIAAVLEEK